MRDLTHLADYRLKDLPNMNKVCPEGVYRIPVSGADRQVRINKLFKTRSLNVIYSDGAEGWEHVSVTVSLERCPTWDEMCLVKNLFWPEDQAVIQVHPAKKDYVNCHPYCLHLWRPVDGNLNLPPKELVGGI